MTAEEKARESARMRDVESWPCYPLLHVKKLGPSGYVAFGVVRAHRPFEVRLKGAFDVAESVESFESVEAMVEAGWIGD